MAVDKNGNEVVLECKIEDTTKPELDYEAVMKELAGLDIERDCMLQEYDGYQKAVVEHGYYSKEALIHKLFIGLRKLGITHYVLENFGFNLPEDYIFKDENGNEILTSKIFLEKKKKELI
jgi:hypothetical protein